MKQLFLSLGLAMTFLAFGQESTSEEELAKQNWMHSNFETTGIYGVADDEARKFLHSKGLTPTSIVVSVIDSGVEIDHPDLKNNIWVNTGEIPDNGIDDDNNGYIDDVYGWDFIGGKDGKDVNDDTLEMTRIVKDFTPVFEGENEATNAQNIATMPETYQMFLAAKKAYYDHIDGNEEEKQFFIQLGQGVKVLLQSNAPDTKITKEFADSMTDPFLNQILNSVASNNEMTLQELEEYCNAQGDPAADPMYDLNFDPRNIVGDDYSDPWQTDYGNNEVEGPDAFHGTHVAGIIAAERNNDTGMNGIAGDVAKIMVVRTVPNGDERDKDVANSIKYSVDNGAKVINMSFGKGFSPYKEVVWHAIDYANKKGVLMFHAAGNDNKDLDTNDNFPTNFRDGKNFTDSWITVGASSRDENALKADFSNFGQEKVDLFSPGTEIYSTVPDYEMGYAQGTSMASPAAAGCAALLWAYFPNLTASQIREILMESVNYNTAPQKNVGEQEDEVPFNQLSVSGGVIDVNKAAQLAYQKYGKKSKSSKKAKSTKTDRKKKK